MRYFQLIFVGIMTMMSCSPETRNRPENVQNAQSATEEISMFDCDTLPTIALNRLVISSDSILKSIRTEYDYSDGASARHKVIVTLNRKEFRFFRVHDTIIVPEIISENINDYSIFPPCYPDGKDVPKLIFISNKYQCYACYENGKLVRFAAANTGKERSQSYPGRYNVNWKVLDHRSSLDSNWVMPYTINFHLQAGNAFHQFTMPGRPVSHSCVRQFRSDAKWLYNWSDRAVFDKVDWNNVLKEGTPVIILDVFDFSRKKFGPWLDLSSNKSVQLELPKNPMEIEEALIPISQIPQGARGRLKNIKRFIYAEDTLRARGLIRPQVVLVETKNFNALRRKKAEAERRKADTTEQM